LVDTTTVKVAEALALLRDSRSPKRRMGAKRLRKLADLSAGPALLAALQKEVHDPRTWETQYQMVMALGECGYAVALPYLQELAEEPFEATMLYVALGDAMVRLGRADENDARPILRLLGTDNDMLIDGAFRAMAMLRMRPDEDAVQQIISYVSGRSLGHFLRFWVAAACPGWSGQEVDAFLKSCLQSTRSDVRQAAEAALSKNYIKWNPL
jgi:HEAT repeat protein